MSERMYAAVFLDAEGKKRTFRCVESQLAKEDWVCPVTKKKIDPVSLRPEVL